MVELVFEDPPEYRAPQGREPNDIYKNRDREEIVARLADHPNRWAVVSWHRSRARANAVSKGLRSKHRGYEFRAANRAGEGVVYGRCVRQDVNLGK